MIAEPLACNDNVIHSSVYIRPNHNRLALGSLYFYCFNNFEYSKVLLSFNCTHEIWAIVQDTVWSLRALWTNGVFANTTSSFAFGFFPYYGSAHQKFDWDFTAECLSCYQPLHRGKCSEKSFHMPRRNSATPLRKRQRWVFYVPDGIRICDILYFMPWSEQVQQCMYRAWSLLKAGFPELIWVGFESLTLGLKAMHLPNWATLTPLFTYLFYAHTLLTQLYAHKHLRCIVSRSACNRQYAIGAHHLAPYWQYVIGVYHLAPWLY